MMAFVCLCCYSATGYVATVSPTVYYEGVTQYTARNYWNFTSRNLASFLDEFPVHQRPENAQFQHDYDDQSA